MALRGDLPPGVRARQHRACRTPPTSSRSCARAASPRSASRPSRRVIPSPTSRRRARSRTSSARRPPARRARSRSSCSTTPLYLRFVDRAAAAGVEIPIIPGILPITELPVVRSFAERVGASVPRVARSALRGPRRRPAGARARLGEPRRRAVRGPRDARRAPRALLHAKPRQPHPCGVPAASGRSGAAGVARRPGGRRRG